MLQYQKLLFLLQLFNHADIHFQRLRCHCRRCQGQPLCQRDVCHSVGFVDLNPYEIFGLGRVLNVVTGNENSMKMSVCASTARTRAITVLDEARLMNQVSGQDEDLPRIIGECSRVPRHKIECSRIGVTRKDCCSPCA